jgi:protein TonB
VKAAERPKPVETVTPPKRVLKDTPRPALIAESVRPLPMPVEPPRALKPPVPSPGPPDLAPPRLAVDSLLPEPEPHPTGPVEGGEAGAGRLAARGDFGVLPGSGTGAGSGATGRGGVGPAVDGTGARPAATGSEDSASGRDSARAGGPPTGFVQPRGGYQFQPAYPESARRDGIQGVTLLEFEVLANGRVGHIRVAQSAGHPDLDQAAVEAVKRWRFEPARRGRQPIGVWVTLPVRFELR